MKVKSLKGATTELPSYQWIFASISLKLVWWYRRSSRGTSSEPSILVFGDPVNSQTLELSWNWLHAPSTASGVKRNVGIEMWCVPEFGVHTKCLMGFMNVTRFGPHSLHGFRVLAYCGHLSWRIRWAAQRHGTTKQKALLIVEGHGHCSCTWWCFSAGRRWCACVGLLLVTGLG